MLKLRVYVLVRGMRVEVVMEWFWWWWWWWWWWWLFVVVALVVVCGSVRETFRFCSAYGSTPLQNGGG